MTLHAPQPRTRHLAVAVAVVLLATGCSEPERATSQPVAAPASSAAVAPSASATKSAAARPKDQALKLGQKRKVTVDGYTVEVTALKVRSGDGFEGVQVRTCNRGAGVNVSRDPWTLGYDNFEQLHDIDTTGGGLPAPAYEERDLAEGECTKGWINFTDVPGESPDGIQYQARDSKPIRWAF
jgi:hypothetical protein